MCRRTIGERYGSGVGAVDEVDFRDCGNSHAAVGQLYDGAYPAVVGRKDGAEQHFAARSPDDEQDCYYNCHETLHDCKYTKKRGCVKYLLTHAFQVFIQPAISDSVSLSESMSLRLLLMVTRNTPANISIIANALVMPNVSMPHSIAMMQVTSGCM